MVTIENPPAPPSMGSCDNMKFIAELVELKRAEEMENQVRTRAS